MLKKISGADCVRILCNKFCFCVVRQKGSHVVLRKPVEGGFVGTVVPKHRELKIGTLKSILALAKVREEDFDKFQ